MRKSLIVQLIILAVVIGAVAMVVSLVAIPWLPDVGAREAGRIDDLYLFTSIICLVIFAIVAAVSVYAVLKFRARPGDEEDGRPIHGHTGIEVVWTAVPAALVTAIAVYSGVVLTKNEELPSQHRTIEVFAQQFAWSFRYPDLDVTTGQLRVPIGEKVELRIRSNDVIHAFWVPEWRLKQDAVPGIVTRLIVTPTKTGEFPIVCTELCGLGHSVMRSQAVVLTSGEYEKWVSEQREAKEAGSATEGAAVFTNAGCNGCHALADAGSSAAVGPDLDRVLPGQEAAMIRESIVNPSAVISEGYSDGVMPQDFGDRLTDEQLGALVDYLLEATR